ncbi:MAG: stage V sporulation protein AD, partial [Tumebacillaceae bacterium]
MPLVGKQTWHFPTAPVLLATGAVGGPKEGQGPLGQDFDATFADAYLGQDSWEKAERRFVEEACQ